MSTAIISVRQSPGDFKNGRSFDLLIKSAELELVDIELDFIVANLPRVAHAQKRHRPVSHPGGMPDECDFVN